VNKDLIKTRFAKCLDTYEQQADVQMQIAQTLAQKAAVYLPANCDSLLEIGCGTGFLTREVLSHIAVRKIYLNDLVDLSDRTEQLTGKCGETTNAVFMPGDAEKMSLPTQLQAVLSASCIQWFVDLPAFFAKVNDALLPKGVFIFNTFGPDNLHEIKQLMDTGLQYPTENKVAKMLTSSFNILEMWEETHVRHFDSPREVLRHMQETGVTATQNSFRWTKKNLQTFETAYVERFGKNGKVTLSWQVYYFVCKKD